MELIGNRPMQVRSTCQSGTELRVFSIWGRGSGLVSQVPCLGDAIVMAGVLNIHFQKGDLPFRDFNATLVVGMSN